MRRLTRWKFAALLACGVAAAPLPVAAQVGKSRVKSDGPSPQPAAQGAAPRETRPEPEALHEKPVSPALEAVLQEWHAKTKDIKKLQGAHHRWTYDMTFGVAKYAQGKFYYEGPDKGRIDVIPSKSDSATIADVSGNTFTLKADQPERWVCDGKHIVRIDDSEKTYEVQPIPAEHQGANIMDGPLPFLFGLPPEKAKQRYDMTLVKQDAGVIYLVIKPKMRVDASNWQRADVMLDAKTFLPNAVQLLDPAATGKTVFKFENVQINPSKILEFFTGDPFRPTLLTYKQVQAPGPPVVQPLTPQGKPIEGVPSVVGLAHKEATTVLGQRGFRNVEMRKGPIASDPKLLYHVAEQSPPPNAALKAGEKIVLTLYVGPDLQKDAQKK